MTELSEETGLEILLQGDRGLQCELNSLQFRYGIYLVYT